MYKKITLFIVSLIALSGLLWLYLHPTSLNLAPKNPKEAQSNQMSLHSTTQEVTTLDQAAKQKLAEENAHTPLFKEEKVMGQSEYGLSSTPASLSLADIQAALDQYYTDKFSPEEKKNSQTPLDQQILADLQTSLDQDAALSGLGAKVDQIEMKLGQDNIYVPRIVVPSTYRQANQIDQDNDIHLMNAVLTEVGNRLVLLCYYNEDNKQVIPYNLSSGSTPLFFNDKSPETQP
ncbi:hypothetical protein [Vaginisenegalia massiliensis]|uniref:hypothetical protein n=1 Tax=Vaginisenegalia massiliensis TaxID=2058294 RepID=UPI000F53AD0F|nr:hypothetical protein [Vaginisenegalia massiliensis]